MLQTSVEIVKPGGTGRPALVISASPDPLPPSRSFMLWLPSALPPPKKYTYFFPRLVGAVAFPDALAFLAFFFTVVVLDIQDSVGRIFRIDDGVIESRDD